MLCGQQQAKIILCDMQHADEVRIKLKKGKHISSPIHKPSISLHTAALDHIYSNVAPLFIYVLFKRRHKG